MKPGFNQRYLYWLEQLDMWCMKHHNLTREQAVSILFGDSPFNPDGPDLVVKKDLFFAESNEFYVQFSNGVLPE